MIRFTVVDLELETLPGLEQFSRAEVAERLPGVGRLVAVREGRLAGQARGRPDLPRLNELRSVVAASLLEEFDVPRPRALLGQQHFSRLVRTCQSVLQAHPSHAFATLRLSAAGADSAVLTRLKVVLSDALGLEVASSGGDLLIALRRSPRGWQALVRTSPRPLSARAWRVCDLPGALNATAAHAMVQLSHPVADEVFVNIACGSGTLLIERLAVGPAGSAIGFDTDAQALECAQANLSASGCASAAALELRDATRLPLDDGAVRTVTGDLPYAMLLGDAAANASLYPALVAEAARVLQRHGRLVLVTTQSRLMQGVVAAEARLRLERVVPFKLSHARGVITPSIYALQRL